MTRTPREKRSVYWRVQSVVQSLEKIVVQLEALGLTDEAQSVDETISFFESLSERLGS